MKGTKRKEGRERKREKKRKENGPGEKGKEEMAEVLLRCGGSDHQG